MPAFRQVVIWARRAERPGAGPRMALRLAQAGRARDRRALLRLPVVAGRIVYKGMLTAPQLGQFYPDLSDPRLESGLALAHARFSTNTFPSWPLAHPYRYVAHNGEFNTVQGNRNWMRTREAMLASDLVPGRPFADLPHRHPGRQRLDELRRSTGAAPPERPVAAPRRADDGPRGVGKQGTTCRRRAAPSTSSTPA